MFKESRDQKKNVEPQSAKKRERLPNSFYEVNVIAWSLKPDRKLQTLRNIIANILTILANNPQAL